MRFLPAPNPEELRLEIGKKLAPALQRLASLDLVRLVQNHPCLYCLTPSQDSEAFGNDWRANLAYLEIMCRRLRDTAGLHHLSERTREDVD